MGEKNFGKDTIVTDYIIVSTRDEVLKLIQSKVRAYCDVRSVNIAVMRYILEECIKQLDYLPLK